MVRSVPHPLHLPSRAVLALLLAGSALSACGDNRPFSRNNTASNATKLAVPSTLTPPVHVGRISGAPSGWRMGEKVAEALRQRDIPAGTAKQGDSAYLLRGEVRETNSNAKSSQVNVVWSLYDTQGKKVGSVTQVAAVPKTAMTKPNDDLIEAIADAAAESISPIVPSTRLDVADNDTTGEPKDQTASRVPAKKVTAIGKQKDTNSGISRNFEAHVKGKDKNEKDEKIALPKPLVPGSQDGKKRVNAIGDIDDGPSALSRNLAKGLNPAAGGDEKAKKVDARPPELADPDRRAPEIAFRQRAKPVRETKSKQVADAPDTKPAPKPKRAEKSSVPRPVVTEFYPSAPKARRQATVPGRAAAVVTIPPKRAPEQTAEVTPKPRPAAVRTEPKREAPKPAAPTRTVPKQEARAPETAPSASGKYVFWVQIGSYRTAELSAAQWTQTRDRAPSLLGSVAHRIDRARVGNRGIWHRIQVGPYTSKGLALQTCQRLKAAQVDCFILPERAGPGVNPISALPPATPATVAARPAAPKGASRVTVVTNDSGDAARNKAPEAPAANAKAARRTGGRTSFPLTTRPGLPGLIP